MYSKTIDSVFYGKMYTKLSDQMLKTMQVLIRVLFHAFLPIKFIWENKFSFASKLRSAVVDFK